MTHDERQPNEANPDLGRRNVLKALAAAGALPASGVAGADQVEAIEGLDPEEAPPEMSTMRGPAEAARILEDMEVPDWDPPGMMDDRSGRPDVPTDALADALREGAAVQASDDVRTSVRETEGMPPSLEVVDE